MAIKCLITYSFVFQLGDSCVRSAFQSKPTTLPPPLPEITTLHEDIETNAIVAPQIKTNVKKVLNSGKKGNFSRKETTTKKFGASKPTMSVSLEF